jgi:hypothetical protein
MSMPNANPSTAPPAPLERRLQRLTAAFAVLAVGFALSIAWNFLPRPEVSASRFMLRGPDGTWRGALALREDGSPTVRLNDAASRARLYGVVLPDGSPRLRLIDGAGRSRLVLELAPDGSPRARLIDEAGRSGLNASLGADGRPVLDVRWGSAFRRITLPDSAGPPETARPRDSRSRGQ